jgi:adenylosuccinate synthase
MCHEEQNQKHQGAKPYRVTSGGIGPAERTKAQRHQDRDEDALVNAIHDRGKEAITGA